MKYNSESDKRQIFERITRVAEDMLRLSHGQGMRKLPEIKLKTNIFNDLGFDSVEVMDLMGLIEREFGVSIEIDKMATKNTFGEIVGYIDELLRKA